jgi:acetoin utilization deacetylase AcuC-like enzyme
VLGARLDDLPGHGHTSEPECRVHNWPLARGAGDLELRSSVADVVRLAEDWRPEVVLVAIGADGHVTDPLSSLQYSYEGYAEAARTIGALAARSRAGAYGRCRRLPAVNAHASGVGDLRRGVQGEN